MAWIELVRRARSIGAVHMRNPNAGTARVSRRKRPGAAHADPVPATALDSGQRCSDGKSAGGSLVPGRAMKTAGRWRSVHRKRGPRLAQMVSPRHRIASRRRHVRPLIDGGRNAHNPASACWTYGERRASETAGARFFPRPSASSRMTLRVQKSAPRRSSATLRPHFF